MVPKVLVLQLDYDKTLLTPKLAAQDSHYLRKLRTNHFRIYCGNEETIHTLYETTHAIWRPALSKTISAQTFPSSL